jgi:acetyl esterase/lipase
MKHKSLALLAALVAFAALLVSANAAHAAAPKKAVPRVACTKRVANYSYAHPIPAEESLTATTFPCRSNAPWVITIHGGSWVNGDRASVQGAVNSFYAHGWQVFNIEYRRGPGVVWTEQLNDVMAAIAWVHAHTATFGINPFKGTLYGFSAGGQMATYAGMLGDGFASSVVSASGVLRPQTVTTPLLRSAEERFLRCDYADAAPGSPCALTWRQFEPETRATADSAPVYMSQGDADPYLPSGTPTQYAAILTAHSVASQVVKVPGLGHDPAVVFDNGPRAYAMFHWVAAHW